MMNPRIARTLAPEDFELPIIEFRAHRVWLKHTETGRGLGLDLVTPVEASRFAPGLALEIENAARVCAWIGRSELMREWDYFVVNLSNWYPPAKPGDRRLVGAIQIVFQRDTLQRLREESTPLSEYPRHWRLVVAAKDHPASKGLLEFSQP